MQGRDKKEKPFKRAFFRKYRTSDGQEVYSVVTQIPRVKKNCLSLEGGGAACVAYAGFIRAYDRYGALEDVDVVAGVSGGAIAALAVALGFTGEEIAQKLEHMPMKEFVDYHDNYSWQVTSALGKFKHLWYSKHRALSDGKKYLVFIQQLVEEKLGKKDATFDDLVKKREEEIRETGESNIKPNLLLNVTDFTGRIGKLVTISRKNPILNLAHATYASGSFPGLLPDLMVDENGVAEPEDIDKHDDPRRYKRYGDGGFKENLCRAALNDQDYYPPGVPHGVINSEGRREHISRNPGVVYVKIDTDEEMNYIRDNVNLERENAGFFSYWFNLGNDALDIQDVDGIRREDVVFLSDNGVSRYDLDLPMKEKMGLVDAADEATFEYLQNRYHAAGHIAVFRGQTEGEAIRMWLDAQDHHEIQGLIHSYEAMRDELKADHEEKKEREQRAEFDPDKPTVKQLQEMINLLSAYYENKFHHQARRSSVDKCPAKFINLYEEFKPFNWEVKIEGGMRNELEHVEDKIAANVQDRDRAYRALCDQMGKYAKGKLFSNVLVSESESESFDGMIERDEEEETEHLERFHGYFDEKILDVVAYTEYLSQLHEKRKDLQVKLGVEVEQKYEPDFESSQEYKRLYQMLDDLQHELVKWPSFKAVLLESLPIVVIENPIPGYKMNIQFDMREQLDRRIYLVAALLFLRQVKSPEAHHFENEFNHFFAEEMPKAVSMDELGKKLGVHGADLQIALFRMEKLIHLFERRHYPEKEPELTIDILIGVSKYSHMRKVLRKQRVAEEKSLDIPMTVFFKEKAGSVAPPTFKHPLSPDWSDEEGERLEPESPANN